MEVDERGVFRGGGGGGLAVRSSVELVESVP